MENPKQGVTVNTINLGYFDIGMITDVPANYREEIMNRIPMQKLGKPTDILLTVEYLINNEYITGSEIDVNGGVW